MRSNGPCAEAAWPVAERPGVWYLRAMKRWIWSLAALTAAAAVAAAVATNGGNALARLGMGLDAVNAWVAAAPVAGAVAYVAVVTVGKISPVPGGLVLLASGGVLFGGVAGAILGAIGSALSAVLVGTVGRRLFQQAIHRRWGARLAAVEGPVVEDGFTFILAARLVPVLPASLVNLVPVVFPVPLPAVFLATVIGVLPVSFIMASLGSHLSSLSDVESVADQTVLTPGLVLPLIGLALLALGPVVVKHVRRRRARRRAQALEQATRGGGPDGRHPPPRP